MQLLYIELHSFLTVVAHEFEHLNGICVMQDKELEFMVHIARETLLVFNKAYRYVYHKTIPFWTQLTKFEAIAMSINRF